MVEDKRIRLDRAVLKKVEGISRASAEKLVKSGQVKVNNEVITKTSFKVNPEDTIKVAYDPHEDTKIEKITIPVIYEDNDVVVINKPEGLLSHSKGKFNPEPTVATWLSEKYTGDPGERAGIVHRLDRLTSGVMICAKNEASSKWLQKQFAMDRPPGVSHAIGHCSGRAWVIFHLDLTAAHSRGERVSRWRRRPGRVKRW